ncbi:hypothetical protein [Acrocarpospora sp. B8E8]|uniref:hypothetical protein n=1 Tax=Acrocarpospora sp. B8E8 TaxID=3153572 RepID=UPI00325C6BF5
MRKALLTVVGLVVAAFAMFAVSASPASADSCDELVWAMNYHNSIGNYDYANWLGTLATKACEGRDFVPVNNSAS